MSETLKLKDPSPEEQATIDAVFENFWRETVADHTPEWMAAPDILYTPEALMPKLKDFAAVIFAIGWAAGRVAERRMGPHP